MISYAKYFIDFAEVDSLFGIELVDVRCLAIEKIQREANNLKFNQKLKK